MPILAVELAAVLGGPCAANYQGRADKTTHCGSLITATSMALFFAVRSSAHAMLPFLVFRFGKPETAAQWIGQIVAAIVALFLVWWMLEAFVLR